MKRIYEWLVFAALAFVLSWVRVEAATVAPSTMWTGDNGAHWAASQQAAVQQQADLSAGQPCSNSFGTHTGWALTQITSVVATGFYSSCVFSDGFAVYTNAWSYVYTYSMANQCPAGFVLRSDTGLCSNVNDTAGSGGGCKSGQDQRMQAPPTASGGAPYEVVYGGCVFRLSQARNCTVNGVDMICGVWTSTGDSATAGSGKPAGSSSTTDTVSKSGCTNSQIVNVSTGVVTCLDSSETKPAIVTTGGVDAAGNQVQVTQKCVGSSCVQSTTTTPAGGGSSTTVSGAVSPGAGAGMSSTPSITFPSDYARDATVSSLANNVRDLHTDLTSATATAPSDPSTKSTDEISGQLLDSSFSSLKAWTLPGRSVSCPVASFTLWGRAYTIDAHCTLWATVAGQVQAVALVSWALLAMFIVLGA